MTNKEYVTMGVGEVTKEARTLVLCFDGTSNEYDADNTNLPTLFALLKKNDFNEQLCYYQPGIGTWFNPGVVSPLFQWSAKILDLAFAWYLDEHVMDGYRFVMKNWRVGDKICLFGFSRGAYTARALAGFLYKVGLLPKDNEQQVPFAYKLFKREDDEGLKLCAGFKQTYCQDVKIEFMGVWDTVASVGVIMGRTLPFVNSNKAIKTFRHALALDEHRAKFRPNLYHRPAPDVEAARADPEQASPVMEMSGKNNGASASSRGRSSSSSSSSPSTSDSGIASGSDASKHKSKSKKKIFQSFGLARADTKDEEGEGQLDDVLEVWFAGCHSDIGGGAVKNDAPHSLANITLRWMVREIVKSSCAIQFDEAALKRANIDLGSMDTIALDNQDALEPINDQLKQNPLWWILEIVPLTFTWQDSNGAWHRIFKIHFGKGRKIPDPNPVFHSSVKTRMESGLKYKPRAELMGGGTVTYVS